ncbi:MAG TPA: hypothetical protein VGI60_04455 [Chthoniobacterales bacterium]
MKQLQKFATLVLARGGSASISLGHLEHLQHEQEGIHDNKHKSRY